jgi:hypothetical protein
MSKHHFSAARVAIALAIIMPTAAALGVAQVPTIPAGTRVRIAAPKPNAGLTGTLKSQSFDSIAVETPDSVRVVSLASVSRIDVSRGVSHLDGGIRGLKIGALGLGGTVATLLLVGYVASPNNDCGGADECLDPGAAMLFLVPAAAIVGGATGFVIGSIIGAEHWDRVYPDARFSVLPARNGRTLIGLSVGF